MHIILRIKMCVEGVGCVSKDTKIQKNKTIHKRIIISFIVECYFFCLPFKYQHFHRKYRVTFITSAGKRHPVLVLRYLVWLIYWPFIEHFVNVTNHFIHSSLFGQHFFSTSSLVVCFFSLSLVLLLLKRPAANGERIIIILALLPFSIRWALHYRNWSFQIDAKNAKIVCAKMFTRQLNFNPSLIHYLFLSRFILGVTDIHMRTWVRRRVYNPLSVKHFIWWQF